MALALLCGARGFGVGGVAWRLWFLRRVAPLRAALLLLVLLLVVFLGGFGFCASGFGLGLVSVAAICAVLAAVTVCVFKGRWWLLFCFGSVYLLVMDVFLSWRSLFVRYALRWHHVFASASCVLFLLGSSCMGFASVHFCFWRRRLYFSVGVVSVM